MEEASNSNLHPKGTKRTADEAQLDDGLQAPRRIKALAIDVVNKIAAGEIIVAPVHALKELLENAVDAGATSIEILVKEGGLKLLQITDNGHGINQDDLPILCERFTTSKLKAFEDLSSIGTYGFRGEALASISHIAHLTITTKTKESSCAWRAQYADGKLLPAKPGQSANPKPVAGRGGTQITVEDLFYNIPTRRRAFRSALEEYSKILDMVGRYAIHCDGVSFSCKKHGESNAAISTPSNATILDRIRQIHGSNVANELMEFALAEHKWGFKAQVWTSNANYHVKKTMVLLFINNRAVESSAIKKGLEQTYSAFLPKGGHPFVYLSLDIDPKRVDVNVHPTKREVHFLNEEEIVERICDEIRVKLAAADTSRTYMTQSLLPGARVPLDDPAPSSGVRAAGGGSKKVSSQKPYVNSLVRTDSKLRKITSMLLPPSQRVTQAQEDVEKDISDDMDYEYTDKAPVVCQLTSIEELRAEVRAEMHNDLNEVFTGHTFVGIVDEQKRIAAVQSGVKLYLVDYGMICNEYFYQLGLTDFGNFGSIQLSPPLKLSALMEIAAECEQETFSVEEGDFDWAEAIATVEHQLVSRRVMLREYFALDISEEGDLLSIPLMLKGYMPSLGKLPRFLLRLGPHVNWNDEKECFASFLRELASFYVPEALTPSPQNTSATGEDAEAGDADAAYANRRAEVNRAVEEVIFPAFRARLSATKGLLKGVMQVADLKGLYRVFERC
ncbi:MAG: DNA mismatch repair protein [Trizodia sp. TS-e1964]|nr:MAG: DNA mismatch repair protein [Trizodia sp. TS-e1964]